MCFGNNQNTETKTTTPSPWITGAAENNLSFVQGLQNKGFTPYTGQFVAPFSDQQQQSFGLGGDVANNAFSGPAAQLYGNYASSGPQSVSPQAISSRMSPYMNQYVDLALQPQIEAQNQQFAGQNKSFDSAATGAGAFGDTGWGQGRTNLTAQQNIARSGLVGNAYNAAFNTAIGAGAQDVANNLQGQTTNANLAETALGRQLTGANAMLGAQTGATNLMNTLGGQQTAASQAGLNALYNQYLQSMQYPFQTAQLYNQTIGAANPASPSTTTTSNPNNAGYGILGSLIGAGGQIGASYLGSQAMTSMLPLLLAASDPRVKENIQKVGALDDGTPVHRFNYKGDPMPRIGLLSTDVEKKTPGAVHKGGPFDMVDYKAATDKAAKGKPTKNRSDVPGGIVHRAGGGPLSTGQPAIVGENGPELFVPTQNGTVLPNTQVQFGLAVPSSASAGTAGPAAAPAAPTNTAPVLGPTLGGAPPAAPAMPYVGSSPDAGIAPVAANPYLVGAGGDVASMLAKRGAGTAFDAAKRMGSGTMPANFFTNNFGLAA